MSHKYIFSFSPKKFFTKNSKVSFGNKMEFGNFFFSNFLSAKVPASPISFSAFFSFSLSGKISGRGLIFFEGSNLLFSRFFLYRKWHFLFSGKNIFGFLLSTLKKIWTDRNFTNLEIWFLSSPWEFSFAKKFAWKLNLWDWCKIHTHSFFSSFFSFAHMPMGIKHPANSAPFLCLSMHIYHTHWLLPPLCV